MPTENRSSNTDPRDLFISRNPLGLGEKELAKDRTGFADQRTHADYLTFLAGHEAAQAGSFAQRHENDQLEQPQGEPVWYMTEGGLSVMHAKAKTLSDQQGLDTSAYNVPLYTHADTGEVERLSKALTLAAHWCASALNAAQRVDDAAESLGDIASLLRHQAKDIEAALSDSAESIAPIAWHVGGNGYDRICFEKPADLPGRPCIQAIYDQRQLIDLLKRYDLRDEDVPPDERAHGIPGTSFQRLNALANQGE